MLKKIWYENHTTDLQRNVYLGVLPILKEYVIVFTFLIDKLNRSILSGSHQLECLTSRTLAPKTVNQFGLKIDYLAFYNNMP